MRKILLLLAIFGLFALPVHAQTPTNQDVIDQLTATLTQTIQLLLQQVALLQAQLAEAIKAQQAQTVTLGALQTQVQQIQTQTTPVPIVTPHPQVLPTVMKEVQLFGADSPACLPGCFLEVYYYENGVRTTADTVTISADEGEFVESPYPGHICIGTEAANSNGSQRKGNPLTCPTRPSAKDGQPVAYFSYGTLSTTTKHSITATVNGVSKTIQYDAGYLRY